MNSGTLNHVASPFWGFRSRAAVGRPTGGLAALITISALWIARSRQRRQLLTLDDRMLADIGISSADADAEARKPFWQA